MLRLASRIGSVHNWGNTFPRTFADIFAIVAIPGLIAAAALIVKQVALPEGKMARATARGEPWGIEAKADSPERAGGVQMIVKRQQDVTPAVLAVMERTADPRLREIVVSLVRHLHGFVRETRMTEQEFREATAILNEMGKLTTDTHNEMVLMAGSLGVSSLVCLLNNGDQGQTKTSQSLLGPFWRLNSP